MMKWFQQIGEYIKKNKAVVMHTMWYLILLILGSIYVWHNRFRIDDITKLDARSVIFLLWLILLFYPLFSELEIGSVKLKKQIKKIEEDQSEIKENIHDLKFQIMETKLINSANNTNNFMINSSLPSKEGLIKLENNIEKNDLEDKDSKIDDDLDISEQEVYLFKVRLSLENIITGICNDLQYIKKDSLSQTVLFLTKKEIIPGNLTDIIIQTIKIANRGVHGEIIDMEYIQFIEKTYPKVLNQLKEIQEAVKKKCSGSNYCICPRCHYSGPSQYSNVCPRCGFVSDDD